MDARPKERASRQDNQGQTSVGAVLKTPRQPRPSPKHSWSPSVREGVAERVAERVAEGVAERVAEGVSEGVAEGVKQELGQGADEASKGAEGIVLHLA